MARPDVNLTRASSTESSAFSNIQVAGAVEEDSIPDSTPPTSLAETASISSAKLGPAMPTVVEENKRSRRARSSVNYNLKQLSDAQQPETTASSRNVSGLTGRTLVDSHDDDDEARQQTTGTPFAAKADKAMDMDWEIPEELPPRPEASGAQRKPSVKQRVKNAAGKVGSVLGKRSREVMEAGKRKIEELKGAEKERQNKYLKELDMGVKGVLDEMDFDLEEEEEAERPVKKAKRQSKAPVKVMAPPAVAASAASGVVTAKKGKKWQSAGLYVGQTADMNGSQAASRKKLQKKRHVSSASEATLDTTNQPEKQSYVHLPMFTFLDSERPFTIPYDVFAPSVKKGDERPKDWHQLNKNRLVGDAKAIWAKEERLSRSLCICQAPANGEQGCDYDCLNRAMHYECNEDNCMLPAWQCSNRPFAELAARTKKGGQYDIGVEVIKTGNRGFGVRACRTFAPGQIVMEYTGEIITEGECQRRMAELYNNKNNYYLMEFDKGLVIDGTKGSMARFVNHSCEPNCEVRMLKVNGTPRMGVFAGESGVMTGEELAYDYNFDNFGSTSQNCYCGAPSCRGSLSKRLNAAEQKLRDKEEKERKRKAAEEAQRNADAAAKAKEEKSGKGSGWRGWVSLSDVKEQLKREKAERDEKEKNSSRARRLAARHGEGPAPVVEEVKPEPKRKRKSTPAPPEAVPDDLVMKPAPEEADGTESATKRRKTSAGTTLTTATATTTKSTIRKVSSESVPPQTRPTHKRALSAISNGGSRFREDMSSPADTARPSSADSDNTVLKTTTSHSVSVAVTEEETSAGAVDEDVKPAAKKRKFGEVLKKAVGLGEKKEKEGKREKGGLRQSTLSFARMT